MKLQHIGDEIWIADGPTVSFSGIPCTTRMAVLRLDDGVFWAWAPVDLDGCR